MGIGPVFELSASVSERLVAILAQEKVRVVELSSDRVLFRRGLACVVGDRVKDADKTLIWLTSPKSHAVNPFFWVFDFRLNTQIGKRLISSGAKRIAWDEFYEVFSRVLKSGQA